MERQRAGDSHFRAPGPEDVDARILINTMEAVVLSLKSSRQYDQDLWLWNITSHTDIKNSVVDIRMRSQLQSAALAVAVHAGYEIGLRESP
mgnify:CR=1 FL=1